MMFGVLGPIEVHADGAPIRLPAGRLRRLLAVLLSRPGEPVSVSDLVDALWTNDPPQTAAKTLQIYIHRLRRILGDPHRIVRHPSGYAIAIGRHELDAHQLTDLIGQARHARTTADLELAADLLAQASALWRGKPYTDIFDCSFVQPEIERLTAHRAQLTEERAVVGLDRGQHTELIPELTAAVAEHPHRECLCALLMHALHGCGRQAEALQAYQRLRTRLAEDLGLDPGPELVQLHTAILRNEAAWPLTSNPPPQPLTAAAGTPRQLPAAASFFVGRIAEFRQLTRLAHAPVTTGGTVVISAIDGIGGIGKTALAVHWAHQIALKFPDGQLFVDLRGYGAELPMPPIEALTGFLRALGIDGERIPVDPAEAAALYRTRMAGKRMLVVLDNAADPGQVRPLIPGTPTCLVIVTSRARLAGLTVSHGAPQLTVEPLTAAESLALLRALTGDGRADADLGAAEKLVKLCGYLPLAVRIAAAQLKHKPDLSLTAYVSRLDNDLLGNLAVAGDKATAVAAVFDHSYARLSHEQQRLFQFLGLCPGPDISADAVAALAGVDIDEARRLLDGLADCSLVELRPHGRYVLHDLLRAYAGAKVVSDVDVATRERATRRLFDWYVSCSAAATEHESLEWLDMELPNLVATARFAEAHGPREVAWVLADTLGGYLWQGRHNTEWLAIAQAGLAAAESAADSRARASSHRNLANAKFSLAHYDEAVEHHKAALRLSREAGWKEGERTATTGLAQVYRELGRLKLAEALLRDALAQARPTSPPAAVANLLNRLGLLLIEAGEPAEAVTCLEESLDLQQDPDLGLGQSRTHNCLAMALHVRGELEEALEHAVEGHALSRRLRDKVGEANKLDTLAAIYRDLGRYPNALDHARGAITLAEKLGDRRIQAHARNTLGETYHRLGENRAAEEQHRIALDLALATNAAYARVAALVGLSTALDDGVEALTAADEALMFAREFGFRMLQGRALTAGARIHLASQRVDAARELAGEAVALHRDGGHRLGEAAALAILESVQATTPTPRT